MRRSTTELVLDYLEKVGEERPIATIARYMMTMHKRTYRATVAAISRLHVAGKIERVGMGMYRARGASNNSAPLTNNVV